MNQPNKSSPYNENNDFLLSFANHPLVTEVMNNGGLGYLNDLRDIQTDNFSNDDKASIIAQIFLADIIADNFNKPINSNNPITTYVSDFSVLESNESVYWWFAEQPVLWATDSDSRKIRPYWADLMVECCEQNLSTCPYEIERYDSILQELCKPDQIKYFNPLKAFNIFSLDEFDFINECNEYDDDMTCEEVFELKKLNQQVLLCLIKEAQSYGLTINFITLKTLYDILMKYLPSSAILNTGNGTRYVTVTTTETITSTFVVKVDEIPDYCDTDFIAEQAEKLLFDLNGAGLVSFGDGDHRLTTSVKNISFSEPRMATVLTKEDLEK